MINIFKKTASVFLACTLFMLSCVTAFAETTETDDIELIAPNAVAIESKTGQILFGKNADEKMYPASTTKVLTAYLTVKNIKDLNQVVEVKEDLSWVEPSSMFLQVGEKHTVRQLLEVLMLKSANDVAVLLAQTVSGSVEEFAKLMNEEATRIGCENSNFVNPNGLPDPNHYSTAHDMALIAKEALTSDIIREIAKTKSVTIPANDVYPHERTYVNTNKFLTGGAEISYNGEQIDSKYEIVEGLKTGYTSEAGRCLLSNAILDGTEVIVGVFNSEGNNVYSDSRAIIDYSLDRYRTVTLLDSQNFVAKARVGGEESFVGYIEEDFVAVEDKATALSDISEDYNYEVTINKSLKSVKKDDIIGEVKIKKDGNKVASVPVLAIEDIKTSGINGIILLGLTIASTLLAANSFRRYLDERRKSRILQQREDAFYQRR